MKKSLLTLATLVALSGTAFCSDLMEVLPDKGGTTFDFKAISNRRFNLAETPQSHNLIKNGDLKGDPAAKGFEEQWGTGYCYIHSASLPGNSPLRGKIRKGVAWEIKDGIATINKTDALLDICEGNKELVSAVSGAYSKRVILPEGKGGRFRLSFKYRYSHRLVPGGCYVLYSQLKADDLANPYKNTHKSLSVLQVPASPMEWSVFSRELTAAPDINILDFAFRIDGIGQFQFTDVSLVPIEAARKIEVKFAPHCYMDNSFAVAQGHPAVPSIVARRSDKSPIDTTKLEHVIRIPKHFNYLGNTLVKDKNEVVKPLEDGRTEVRLRFPPYMDAYVMANEFNYWCRIGIMLSSDALPGTKGTLEVHSELDGEAASDTSTLELFVIPGFAVSKSPKRYANGMDFMRPGGDFTNEAAINAYAKFFGDMGVGWILGNPAKNLKAWRQNGVRYVTPEHYFIANGFRVGNFKERPADDAYVCIGDKSREIEMATCPVVIYEERDYFVNKVKPMLAKALEGCDGLWANWEPYMFTGKGCVCDRCCHKFADYMKVPYEDMKKDWPAELGRGKKYFPQIQKFRSLEHAKLVKTINKAVKEICGKDSLGFIPGIAWSEMGSYWHSRHPAPEVEAIDYAGDLSWIDPWGPYPCWDTQQPYSYKRTNALTYFLAAKDVREQVNKDYPDGKRPRLMAFPHGLQCSEWVAQPEEIGMGLDSFFFNRWESSILYYFPSGYDHRYWKAFAESTERAAKYEDAVIDGKRVDDQVVLTPVPEYAAPTAVIGYLPHLKNTSFLQHAAYEHKGQHIVAVLNFWQLGEAYFKLQVKGLSPRTKYNVLADNAFLAPSLKKQAWTGAELEKGIFAMVGSMRTTVFQIAKQGQLHATTVITAKAVQKLYEARRAELATAAEWDRKLEEMNNPKDAVLSDFDNDGIHAKADNAAQTFILSSGDKKLILNVRNASVTSWMTGDKELIHGDKSTNGFGVLAFWKPAWQPADKFRMTSQEAIKGGIRVTCEMNVTGQMNTDLEFMKIIQVMEFTDNLKKVLVKTTLQNNSTDEAPRVHQFGMRYHCFPAAAGLKGGYGIFEGTDGKPIRYVRDFKHVIYALKDDTEFTGIAKAIYLVKDPVRQLGGPAMSFAAPGMAKLSFKPEPADKFAGIALWDESTQYCSTIEPCFQKVTLKSKEAATFSISASVE